MLFHNGQRKLHGDGRIAIAEILTEIPDRQKMDFVRLRHTPLLFFRLTKPSFYLSDQIRFYIFGGDADILPYLIQSLADIIKADPPKSHIDIHRVRGQELFSGMVFTFQYKRDIVKYFAGKPVRAFIAAKSRPCANCAFYG